MSGDSENDFEGSDSDCDDSHCEPARWTAEDLQEGTQARQEYEKRLAPVKPSTLEKLRSSDPEDLTTGKTFPSRASFALTVAGRNEVIKRLVRVKKSTPLILCYVCVSGTCGYYVVARLPFDRRSGQFTTWTVGASRGHTCSELQRVTGRKRTNYSASQLVPAFQDLIQHRNSISRPTLRNLVDEYVAWEPSATFVQRIVAECVSARVGSDESCEGNIAKKLGALEAQGHVTFYETEALDDFKKRLFKIELAAEQQKAREESEEPRRDELRARAHAAVDVKVQNYEEGDEIILHMGFAPSNLARGDTISTYVPVIALDAAHMKNREGGNIFNAVIRDANGQIQLLFFMVTMLNESKESWTKFLQFGHSVYGNMLDNAQTIFVADGDKGGRNAVRNIWKHIAPPFMCSRHLAEVVRKKRPGDAALFHGAVHARTRREVHDFIDKMCVVNQRKLRGVPIPSDADEGAIEAVEPAAAMSRRPEYDVLDLRPENFSLIFSEANRGVATSNWVEGIHGTMLSSRCLNMIACFLDVIHAEFKRYHKHRDTAEACLHDFPPNVQKELDILMAEGRVYEVSSTGNSRYVVCSRDGRRRHHVDLSRGADGDRLATCSCPLGALESNFWEPHILAAAEIHGDRESCSRQ